MQQQDIMLTGKSDQVAEQSFTRCGTGRHVRKIHDHDLHAVEPTAFDLSEIGHPAVLLTKQVIDTNASRNRCGGVVGRITGIGDQHLIAGVQVSHTNMHDTLFRTD